MIWKGQWYARLLIAIESLSQMPTRGSLARENEFFSQDVRQLLYGKGRSVYLILSRALFLRSWVVRID
jgi:hypothetical protein